MFLIKPPEECLSDIYYCLYHSDWQPLSCKRGRLCVLAALFLYRELTFCLQFLSVWL